MRGKARLRILPEHQLIFFKTGTLYGPDNLAVPGKVEGRNCQITIDTGSNISIVRPDVLPEKKQSEIQPVNQCIRTVTGEKAPIRGKGNLRLRIGSKKGTEIARCEQVASVVLQQKEIAKAESEMLHLPEHLKELYIYGLTKDQCQQTMYFLDAVASREATSSNAFPSSFSFSPFQNMMRHLYQIPVLHTKEGILTVGSICWNVSLHCFI